MKQKSQTRQTGAAKAIKDIRMTPHNSGWTEALIDRRWTFVAANIDRLARGELLQNIVFEGTGGA